MLAEDRFDRAMLDAVAALLARSSTAALDASHELLAHYADTGDPATQRAVDTMIDRAADALRALTDALTDTSVTMRYVKADRSAARSDRGRDHFA